MAANPQVWWNNTALDNGTWRLIDGGPIVVRSESGLKTLAIAFLIEADDDETLQERYRETVDAFGGRNHECRVATIDADDAVANSDYLEKFQPGDGYCIQTLAQCSMDTTRVRTATSIPMQLVVMERMSEFNDASGPLFRGSSGQQGQSGSFVFSKVIGPGGVEARVVEATFIATPAISSPPAPSPVGAMNGKENYEAAREAILTDYLGCAADGGRGAGGFALVLESADDIEGDEANYRVNLRSSYVPEGLPADARQANVSISITHPERWDTKNGGSVPVFATLKGSVAYKTAPEARRGLLAAKRASLLQWLKARAQTSAGGKTVTVLTEAMSLSEETSTVAFEVVFQCGNADIINLTVTTMIEEIEREVWYSGQKKEYPQTTELGPAITVTVAITRVGIPAMQISMAEDIARSFLPAADKFKWWRTARRLNTDANLKMEFGAGVAAQHAVVVFTKRVTDATQSSGSGGGTSSLNYDGATP